MFIHKPRPFDPVGGTETPERVALAHRSLARRRLTRRAFGISLVGGGIAAAGYAGYRWLRGRDEDVLAAGRPDDETLRRVAPFFPAHRDERFTYGRPETVEVEAARYTNFYEFSRSKWSWRYVEPFRTEPWTLSIGGLCRNPMTLAMDDLLARFARELCERQYRHRCVERWAMAIPWTGLPLKAVLQAADPLAAATHVRFVSFQHPDQEPRQAPATADASFPWPYTEGLTMAEAACELPFLAVGMYGHALLKQHGAPLRLVVPWKYGYKSIKSIERIEWVDRQPLPFWTEVDPRSYPFTSNVDPSGTIPWSQKREEMLGTGEEFPTQLYNGYEKYVAHLYR
ncbi:MAG: protein-methionine-sulfoxide reductase catalytic subunit MsrP [Planctomycetia bacterium]|nr:protein-methionine-sulfoxide reductase catalytic subunit MsrP [Planctomycetia bacterium]